MPSEITSIPAAFFSATLRSSSANMYGGIASRRLEGSVRPMRRVRLSSASSEARERPDQLIRQLAAVNGLGRSGERDVEALGDLDDELAAGELHRDGAGGPGQECRHRGASG